jgi:DNA-binding NtrC family response regulator
VIPIKLLIFLSDDAAITDFSELVTSQDVAYEVTTTIGETLQTISDRSFDLIFVSSVMAEDVFLNILPAIIRGAQDTPVIVVSEAINSHQAYCVGKLGVSGVVFRKDISSASEVCRVCRLAGYAAMKSAERVQKAASRNRVLRRLEVLESKLAHSPSNEVDHAQCGGWDSDSRNTDSFSGGYV